MGHFVVTGGVGFIGFHLSRALLARGESVLIVDDFSEAPYPTVMKRRNAADLAADFPQVRIVEGCVTDTTLMHRVTASATAVVHLAGLAGVRPSFATPAHYARVNVEGTAVAQEAARLAGAAKFLFASSSSVYGNATPLPAAEDAPAVFPESPYAATKRAAELVAGTMARKSPAMTCTALRFFTVYGPRQRPEMAITLFTREVCAGRPITMFGDGSMRRDFTHVDDIVRGILAAVDRAPAGFRAYNLGSGSPIRLDGLVEAIGRAADREPRVQHAPVPMGDVDATYADITRAQRELEWSPRVPLVDGLATVVDWIRNADAESPATG